MPPLESILGPGARSEPMQLFREALEHHLSHLFKTVTAAHDASCAGFQATSETAAQQASQASHGTLCLEADAAAGRPEDFREALKTQLGHLSQQLLAEHEAAVEGFRREIGAIRNRLLDVCEADARGGFESPVFLSDSEAEPFFFPRGLDPRGPGKLNPVSKQPQLSERAKQSDVPPPPRPDSPRRSFIRSSFDSQRQQSKIAPHIYILSFAVVPDRRLTLCESQSSASRRVVERMGTWEGDTMAFSKLPEVNGKPLSALMQYLFKEERFLRRLPGTGLLGSLPPGAVRGDLEMLESRIHTFIEKVEAAHCRIPYHNSTHAADVTNTMEAFLQYNVLHSATTPLDHMVCLIVAAVHDLGHNGRNNAFHIGTQSRLALQYNDRSPLENMHVAVAFEVMSLDEDCRWLALLETKYQEMGHSGHSKVTNLQTHVRKMMTSMVLHTDAAHHAKLMQSWDEFLEAEYLKDGIGKANLPFLKNPEKAEQKQLLLDFVLHMADISNQCKPFEMALEWTRCLMLEFWAQGDEEASLGLPISPLCDRSVGFNSIPQSQIDFISFFVGPAYESLATLTAETAGAIEHMRRNSDHWEDKRDKCHDFYQIYPSHMFVIYGRER